MKFAMAKSNTTYRLRTNVDIVCLQMSSCKVVVGKAGDVGDKVNSSRNRRSLLNQAELKLQLHIVTKRYVSVKEAESECRMKGRDYRL